METNIKDRWKQICNEYTLLFANKHGFDIQYELEHGYLWIGDNPGTICEICDMFIGMEDIRYDIDHNISEEKFQEWYWKNLEVYELTNHNWMNYESYCKGAPDQYPEEKLEKIRQSKKRVEEAQKDLNNLIDNITKNKE